MPDALRFIGEDSKVLAALRLVERIAPTRATVLIVGETGTGKEIIARLIHARSDRAQRPFIAVNCGAVAQSVLESELFGHARGAFTGANTRHAGRFEAAHAGTLFLDELTSMSQGMQSALLRVLQFGEFCPVGVSVPVVCDVRVVAAANRDPRELVAEGAFRADLYYRVNIIRIDLPPLRERRGDLPLLIEHHLKHLGAQYRRPGLRLDSASQRELLAYDYPGNVRELETILHRAILLAEGSLLSVRGLIQSPGAVPATPGDADPAVPRGSFHDLKAAVVERFEREYLNSALHRSAGVVTEAARVSGLSERNFHLKLRKYGLDRRPADQPAPSQG